MTFRKIAVLRASALGDFIFALPALTALRQSFPESSLVYLGKEWHRDFLAERKNIVDRVIVIPKTAGVGMPESFRNNKKRLDAFFKATQAERFDLAVQLQGGGKFSNPFIQNLKAKYSIGTKTPDASDLSTTIPYRYYQSEYARWLEVVSLVGAKTKDIMPRLKATVSDTSEAKNVLKTKKKFVVIHPGSTDPRRRWEPEKFGQVGDYLAKKGLHVMVTGSGDEKEIVETVISSMKYKAQNLYNVLSIKGLAGLLSLAALVISNDTGPLHLADALGNKTIGLYWCGNLINGAPLFHNNNICLGSWMVECPLCNVNIATVYPFEPKTKECSHLASFVSAINSEDVIMAANQLLSQ